MARLRSGLVALSLIPMACSRPVASVRSENTPSEAAVVSAPVSAPPSSSALSKPLLPRDAHVFVLPPDATPPLAKDESAAVVSAIEARLDAMVQPPGNRLVDIDDGLLTGADRDRIRRLLDEGRRVEGGPVCRHPPPLERLFVGPNVPILVAVAYVQYQRVERGGGERLAVEVRLGTYKSFRFVAPLPSRAAFREAVAALDDTYENLSIRPPEEPLDDAARAELEALCKRGIRPVAELSHHLDDIAFGPLPVTRLYACLPPNTWLGQEGFQADIALDIAADGSAFNARVTPVRPDEAAERRYQAEQPNAYQPRTSTANEKTAACMKPLLESIAFSCPKDQDHLYARLTIRDSHDKSCEGLRTIGGL